MPRSRFSGLPREPAVFVDRHDHLNAISGELFELRKSPRHLKVVEVTGLGGVGKTRLLRRLRELSATADGGPRLLWLSLESERMTGPEGPLFALRGQFTTSCLLFDAALVRLWSATGQPFQLTPDRITSSLVFKAVDAGRAVSKEFALPLGFAVDAYRAAAKKVVGSVSYKAEEFAEIDAFAHDPEALRERLPHYLALDIARLQDQALVVFYDAYDRQSSATLSGRTVWLQEFIATLGCGLHVIASREPLGWPDDWLQVTLPIRVEELPDAEARELVLARAPNTPDDVQDRLLLASERIPFFLEAALVAYVAQRDGGETVTAAELPETQEEAVVYLLKHLDPAEREVAVALASAQRFDRELFSALVKDLNLAVPVTAFTWFTNAFFTSPISPGLYKTHDVLTAFVRSSVSHAPTREAALTAALRHLAVRINVRPGGPSDVDAALVGGLATAWRSVASIPQDTVELLLDACYALYDAGYWRELASIAVEVPPDDHPIAVIADYFAALAMRRREGIGPALERLERIEPKTGVFGRHRSSLDLEVAYLSELDGNYARARSEFRRLQQAAESLDPADRNQVRAWLYHGDMLTMDGDLVEAARVLLEGAERVGSTQPAVRLEFLRHRAHAFRFSFATDRAADLYRQVLRGVPNSPGMQAKLLTNLAETLCWVDPAAALADACAAMELHERLGNRIELAKCEAAGAVAHAKRGEHAAAADSVERALRHASATGYRAAEAFALQARVIGAHARGDESAAAGALVDMGRVVDGIGTYDHLLAVATLAAGDEAGYVNHFARVRWLDADVADERLRAAARA